MYLFWLWRLESLPLLVCLWCLIVGLCGQSLSVDEFYLSANSTQGTDTKKTSKQPDHYLHLDVLASLGV